MVSDRVPAHPGDAQAMVTEASAAGWGRGLTGPVTPFPEGAPPPCTASSGGLPTADTHAPPRASGEAGSQRRARDTEHLPPGARPSPARLSSEECHERKNPEDKTSSRVPRLCWDTQPCSQDFRSELTSPLGHRRSLRPDRTRGPGPPFPSCHPHPERCAPQHGGLGAARATPRRGAWGGQEHV